MATQDSKSKLERYEDAYRDKLWSLDQATGLIDILASQLKVLPAALIVNGIAIIATRDQAEIIRNGAMLVFYVVLVWLVLSFGAFELLNLRLPKIRRHVEMARRNMERSRGLAEEMFREYKTRLMPYISEAQIDRYMIDDTGKVAQFRRKQTWHNTDIIPEDTQRDMAFIDEEGLVGKMDTLEERVQRFYDAFEVFSTACWSTVLKWSQTKKGDIRDDEFTASAIIALYRFYNGVIQNENDIMDAQRFNLIDSDGRTFLEKHFFKGDPTQSTSISSLMTRADLSEKARSAHEAHLVSLIAYDEVLAILRYTYTAGK